MFSILERGLVTFGVEGEREGNGEKRSGRVLVDGPSRHYFFLFHASQSLLSSMMLPFLIMRYLLFPYIRPPVYKKLPDGITLSAIGWGSCGCIDLVD